MPDRELIDPLMWDLIVYLNEIGHETMFCCQGRRTLEEFKTRKHLPTAYIAFHKPLSIETKQRAKQLKLRVYGIHHINCIASYRQIRHWTDEAKNLLIQANETFNEKIRSIYGSSNVRIVG